MRNTIYLRRKRKLVLEEGTDSLPPEYLICLQANIQSLGFRLAPRVLDVIETMSVERFSAFYKKLIRDLELAVGGNVVFKPMYPNFPEQVINASTEELHSNAMLHYLGDWLGKRLLPKFEKMPRPPLQEVVGLKVVDLGTKEEFNAIFGGLLRSMSAMSETDRADLHWFVTNSGKGIHTHLPPEIPCKENAAALLAVLIERGLATEESFSKYCKTATDVLRVAVAVSGGDISLGTPTKFRNTPKRVRHLLLGTLERIGTITEDMLRHKEPWKRLGERLHPSEFSKRYPRTCEAFDVLRNDKPFATFNGKVEHRIKTGDAVSAAEILQARPGELARRLDKLVRMSDRTDQVLEIFGHVAGSVSSPVLLQVRTHFAERNRGSEWRTFFPKGDICKVKAIENRLPAVDEAVCQRIAGICEDVLVERFGRKKPLGKVYIDEDLRHYTVPFAMRSASKALKTVSRGSRIALPPGGTIRFFIYWKDGSSRTDLDLSALALDAESRFKTVISYYNLKDLGGHHSGDITSAPNGASEFIDVDIGKFIAQGIRYVLMSINSYTQQPYCDLPMCFAGFMMRQNPNSGEIYEPTTVENKFDLTANTKIAVPMIIDLMERQVVWTDLSLQRNPSASNNVHNNLSSLTILNKAMTTMVKPNLFDLFALHVRARGERVLTRESAEATFSLNQGITPLDTEVIMSEFL